MKTITPQGNLNGFMMLGKPPADVCQECATAHAPEMPHNLQSLAYQFRFHARMGGGPTWADAMAHCAPEVRAIWTKELERLGQEIGQLTVDQTKALSLRQPWAWLMIRPDMVDSVEREIAAKHGLIKNIENRKWRTHYRGRVLVHASARMTRADYEEADAIAWPLGVKLPDFKSADLQRGGIVGEFTITNCVAEHASPWFFGPFGFTVTDAKSLTFQACKGKLGFFNPQLIEA